MSHIVHPQIHPSLSPLRFSLNNSFPEALRHDQRNLEQLTQFWKQTNTKIDQLKLLVKCDNARSPNVYLQKRHFHAGCLSFLLSFYSFEKYVFKEIHVWKNTLENYVYKQATFDKYTEENHR